MTQKTRKQQAQERQNEWKKNCPHKRGTWGWSKAHPPVLADVERAVETFTRLEEKAQSENARDFSAITEAKERAISQLDVAVAKWNIS